MSVVRKSERPPASYSAPRHLEFASAEARVALDWESMRNRPLTLDEKRALRRFYDGNYQLECKYCLRHPWLRAIANYRLDLTRAVFPKIGKVLDAGCASGETVSAFRSGGVDAWGFDICPDLLDVVHPESRPYVRMGRFDAIPFSHLEGFDTLVSFDVVEHVPIDELEVLPRELMRLGIRQVGCIISNDVISPGHVTIQETRWYEELFAQAGFRLMRELDHALDEVIAPVGWDEAREEFILAKYNTTGRPRNGWNAVPGHLFFSRD